MAHVYIVESHYDYEGPEIEDVYADEADAIAHAKTVAVDRGYGGVEGYRNDYGVWEIGRGSAQITVSKWDVKAQETK